MIATHTVLVLGAGASCPYGFPTGLELKHLVLTSIAGTDGIDRILEAIQGKRVEFREVESFRDALRASNLPSVDLFLERRQEFLEVGKYAIAKALIPFERVGQLVDQGRENWYHDLLRGFVDEVTTLRGLKASEPLKIVTFNYDRSIDYFLVSSVASIFSVEPEEAHLALSQVAPILHIYGQLGELPSSPVEDTRGLVRSYSNNAAPIEVRRGAQGLRLISEGAKEEFTLARQWIGEATRLLVLGFGFNKVNVRALGLDRPRPDGQSAFATGFKLERRQRDQIQARVQVTVLEPDNDVLLLLRRRVGDDW